MYNSVPSGVFISSSTPSPDWNCQWGPSGARIAYTRAMSEHRCFPKKKLSTHTMHFKWHHRNLSTNDHESLERKRIMNEDTHLLLMWKEKSLYIPVYKVDMHNDRQLDLISTTVDVFCRLRICAGICPYPDVSYGSGKKPELLGLSSCPDSSIGGFS